jgi:hypothetical protein
MLSFLSLPPETRIIIYDLLLDSSRSSNARILAGVNNFRRQGTSSLVRHKSVYRVHQDHIRFDGSGSTFLWRLIGARCNIHLADIGDLLFLAATCRLLRSELLALAWSNADMAVRSPTLYMDLHYIFYDRLPHQICTFIQTLQIDADKDAWSPQQMFATSGLILRRLPHLKKLVIYIPRRVSGTHKKGHGRMLTLATLRILPLRITVKISHHIAKEDYKEFMRYRALTDFHNRRREWNKSADSWLLLLRARVNWLRQKRSGQQMRRKQEDQVADVLEATVELRSLGIL